MQILTIIGPTAIGKTSVAIKVAHHVQGEIISADSRQIFRLLKIGTAQPTPEQRRAIPFHCIDIVDPDQLYSCGQFAREAEPMIADIINRKRIPIVCGGTGLYIKALFDPLHPLPESDNRIKQRLLNEIKHNKIASLYERLNAIDPDWADKIGPHDKQRIIRGLEVYELTGMPLSQLITEVKRTPRYQPCYIGLNLPRDLLYKRINERFDTMIQQGFLEEVRDVLDQGYDPGLNALRSIGYKEIIAHLMGRLSLHDATEKSKQRTRNFAKRQLTWFRKLPDVQWYDPRDSDLIARLLARIQNILKN